MSAAAAGQLLPAAARVALPWKNGGGITRELAVFPAGADFDTCQWRISLAEISTAGPFSVFEGIERHLAVISGALRLKLGDAPACSLTARSPVAVFQGETPVFASPQGGVATDVNVMVRRGQWRVRMTREALGAQSQLALPDGLCFLLALSDITVTLEEAGRAAGRWRMATLDALRIDAHCAGPAPLRLLACSAGDCLLIVLKPQP